MSKREIFKRQFSSYFCMILNVTVLISGIVSIYLATSSGKACIERLRGANGDDEETSKNKKKVQVAPAASKKKEEGTPRKELV